MMLSDLDETIEHLLRARVPADIADIRFDSPTPDNSGQWQRPTINVFLYDIQENKSLRQPGWQQQPTQGDEKVIHRKRKPIRLDYHYLISPWVANDPKGAHLLLDLCLQGLYQAPVLHPDRHLLGALKQQPCPAPVCIAGHEKFAHLAEIWGAVNNVLRPSISYTVTLALDPWDEEVSGRAIHTFELRIKQKERGYSLRNSEEAAGSPSPIESTYRIAGTVWQGTRPATEIKVRIREVPLAAETNQDGRFSLVSLSAGTYTLEIWPTTVSSKRPLKTRRVQVPPPEDSKDMTYDIHLP